MQSSRRDFMKLFGAGAMVAPLAALSQHAVATGGPSFGPGFGPLQPMLPVNTDELLVYRTDVPTTVAYDLRGVPLISLPKGFSYRVVSFTGQTMTDGTLVPGDHDGMAAYRGPQGATILVRNHELSNREGKFGNLRGVDVADDLKFDTWANGGTTTLMVDTRGRLVSHWASLGGTNNNCAGGPTPWGTWLTCEETTQLANASFQQRHGYVFEVPAFAHGATPAQPIVGMGRFNHEATATDPDTGIVYETEDTGDSLFYRFVPHIRGNLLAGGTLQALKLRDSADSVDTGIDFTGLLNRPLAVEWVTIDVADPLDNVLANSTRGQGRAKGAARFRRGEGAWYADGKVYFVSTSGGAASAGQVFAYDPASETLTLIVESTDRAVLDAPDNITVGPDKRLYLFEDGGGQNNIVGVNADGELFRVAENSLSEFCGGCFSHDGRFMFVNIQSPGLTLVIEGPWRKGRR
jgi:uncharacterized repeat protein (TIGR03803 family)